MKKSLRPASFPASTQGCPGRKRAFLVSIVGLLGMSLGAHAAPATAPRAGAPSSAPPAERCRSNPTSVRIVSIERDGDVGLGSGRVLRLVDLRLPDAERDRAASSAVLRSLIGEDVEAAEVGGPDRWGRIPAMITLTGSKPVSLAELLVGEGLAIVDTGERDDICRPELLGSEDSARRRGVGLWKNGAVLLRSDDLDGLGKADGRFGIVEGRVLSVGERRERTYLNFGRDFARDFNVTVPKRSWAAFKARGWTAETLRGARLRVRGTLELRRSPTMEVSSADVVEMVEPARAAPDRR